MVHVTVYVCVWVCGLGWRVGVWVSGCQGVGVFFDVSCVFVCLFFYKE